VTNGEPVIIRAAMKPISTTLTPMDSVDVRSGEPAQAIYQRSDICAVPAAMVVGEAMVAYIMADALLEKFGGDSMDELLERVESMG
jgi:chorismate synthase